MLVLFVVLLLALVTLAVLCAKFGPVYMAKGLAAGEANGGKHTRAWWFWLVAASASLILFVWRP